MPRPNGPYQTIRVQQRPLTIVDSGGLNTVLIDRATPAPADDMIASLLKKRNVIEGEEESIKNEPQATEGKVAGSELCITDDRLSHPAPVASKNIDEH